MNPKRLSLLLPLLVLCFIAQGCLSDSQRLYVARQSYVSAENAMAAAIDADVVSASTVDQAVAARDIARQRLTDADAAFTRGDKLSFEFLMGELNSAIDEFVRVTAPFKKVSK